MSESNELATLRAEVAKLARERDEALARVEKLEGRVDDVSRLHKIISLHEGRVVALEAALRPFADACRPGGFGGAVSMEGWQRARALLAPAEPRNRAADTRIARKALDDYLAERRDSRGLCPWCNLPANPPHDSIACRLRVVRSAEPEAPPPAKPCATCGGSGWLWKHEHPEYRDIPDDRAHDDTRYLCPACAKEPRRAEPETCEREAGR